MTRRRSNVEWDVDGDRKGDSGTELFWTATSVGNGSLEGQRGGGEDYDEDYGEDYGEDG